MGTKGVWKGGWKEGQTDIWRDDEKDVWRNGEREGWMERQIRNVCLYGKSEQWRGQKMMI